MKNFHSIEREFTNQLKSVACIQDLANLKAEFLGKSGVVTLEMKKIGQMDAESKKAFGESVNALRNLITHELQKKQEIIENIALEKELSDQSIDITLPGRKFQYGSEHPISKAIKEINDILRLMGFTSITGPEVEDDWHNFTALNVHDMHPARQSHDTFYIKDRDLLLRTHTSSVQIRHMQKYMQNNKPPIRVISAGKVYRADYDTTHSPMFHQIEAIYVANDVNVGHLKGCITTFLKAFFCVNDTSSIRFRNSYFPFTVPSFEVDIKCDRTNRDSLKIGSGNDWLEIMGSGMVHPKVLENVGINPKEYSGFAFGCGIERLAMLKYQIPDLRKFFECDMRWLGCYS